MNIFHLRFRMVETFSFFCFVSYWAVHVTVLSSRIVKHAPLFFPDTPYLRPVLVFPRPIFVFFPPSLLIRSRSSPSASRSFGRGPCPQPVLLRALSSMPRFRLSPLSSFSFIFFVVVCLYRFLHASYTFPARCAFIDGPQPSFLLVIAPQRRSFPAVSDVLWRKVSPLQKPFCARQTLVSNFPCSSRSQRFSFSSRLRG